MNHNELMKALAERARELGWDVEYNWKDTTEDPKTEAYDLYVWRLPDAKAAR